MKTILSALALGVLLFASAARAGEACGPLKAKDGKPIALSRHAAHRLQERKVGCATLKRTLEVCEAFRYHHQDRIKTGCFDKKEKVFVALEGGTILTVIADPGTDYVERLKRRR